MNKLYKLLIFTAAVAISGLIICSCGNSGDHSDGSGTSQNSDNVSESDKGNTPAEQITIENISEYKIICSEKANASVNKSVFALRDSFTEKEGITPECADDFIRKNSQEPIYKYEILVGNTNREESKVGELDPLEYMIRYADGKIVIAGGSDGVLEIAVRYFSSECMKGGKIIMPKEIINKVELSELGERVIPVFTADFDNSEGGQYVSSNGEATTRLINCDEIGGYSGNALRFHGTPNGKGGALLPPGTAVRSLDGATSYTVAMWIMPYQSYHGSRTYRLFTLVGEKNNTMLFADYSSPLIRVHAESPDGKEFVTIDFPYALDTVIPPFDAVNTNDGVWQFIAVTVDFEKNTVKLFVNGKEIVPKSADKVNFGGAKINGNATVKYEDCIGGDTGGQQRSFNGIIDTFTLYNNALTGNELELITNIYGKSENPSVTEDQAILDEIVEKLGSGIAILGNSANAVYAKRVVKADGTDYTVTNPIINGEVYIAENLLKKFTDKKITDGKKTVGGKNYYSAKAVAKALGLNYIDKTSENGMFVMYTDVWI